MANLKEPSFLINPDFSLTAGNISVQWHEVGQTTLNAEAVYMPPEMIFSYKKKPVVLIIWNDPVIDIIYTPETDFGCRGIQSWLRTHLRDIISEKAKLILPQRVEYWLKEKGLECKCKGTIIKKLRKYRLGQCTFDNIIELPPMLLIFKTEWLDGVILHEMAHFTHKHHRKSFRNKLTELLGQDSNLAKVKDDIALAPYYAYYQYLMK